MSAAPKPTFISVEQYLAEENDNPLGIRHEYVNGLVYAMAGASRGHHRVTIDILPSLILRHAQ